MNRALWLAALLGLLLLSASFPLTSASEDFDDDDLVDVGADAKIDNENEPQLNEPPVPMPKSTKPSTAPYVPPGGEGLLWMETFDNSPMSERWIPSKNAKFSGEWRVQKRDIETLVGDVGLRVMNEARHHGISSRFPRIESNEDGHFVVSYEAKFEEDLQCGGGYMKVFDSKTIESGNLADFSNETPYVVMFGPDRCGATNKVHVIIKQKNPINGEWVEHHLQEAPSVPVGKDSHHYALHVAPDNSYEVYIDGKVSKTGSMETDFMPPFTPPKMIDDPTDTKPHDWVDEAKIPDPEAKKPEDWDEDAPVSIPDPESKKPDGWLDDEPKMVPDPEAVKPEDWDDEEDGNWVAPSVPNPKCKEAPGCGEWTAPLIANPNFKGKWSPPLIDNPEYKGPWTPKQIDNPNYFESKKPHMLSSVDAVGFELWTMQKGLLFDNIAISRDMSAVKRLVDESWTKRHELEKAVIADKAADVSTSLPLLERVKLGAVLFVMDHPVVAIGAMGLVSLFIVWKLTALCRSRPLPKEEPKVEKRVERKKSGMKSGDEREDDDEAEKEEEEEEEEEAEEIAKDEDKKEREVRQRKGKVASKE